MSLLNKSKKQTVSEYTACFFVLKNNPPQLLSAATIAVPLYNCNEKIVASMEKQIN